VNATTDGVVRWTGNPHEEEFVSVVHKVMAADPLVRARNHDIRLTADDIEHMPVAGEGELDWPDPCPTQRRYSENDMHDEKLIDWKTAVTRNPADQLDQLLLAGTETQRHLRDFGPR